ncbi:MAG: large protein, partial [Cytophagaceae bacterium]|nr:large protein [Cytophagaceae bacterium]
FYIQGVATTSACNTADEEVKWKTSEFNLVTTNGNSITKVQSNSWNGGAGSWNTVSDNGYLQFTVSETNSEKVIGLSSTNLNFNYTSIQFGLYLTNTSAINVMESGINRGSYGNYSNGDIFKIAVEANVVKYYKNNTLFYISSLTPVLPMLVDVSLKNIGATVNNVVVSNYNSGNFIATAINAGATPVYQWKLNGTDVGTNTNTYTNTSLGNNDVVTCTLTPSIGGCSNTNYVSNSITNIGLDLPVAIDFYVIGSPVSSACATADEQVRWKNSDNQNLKGIGNSLIKIQSNGSWDGGAASLNKVSNNGYMQFTCSEVNKSRMVGLSTTNANSNFTSIQYAFYLTNSGLLAIYESGTSRGSFGAYATNDILKIAVQAGVVKYYKNSNLLYTSIVPPTLPLIVDVSILNIGATISNVIVSNLNTGNFTAVATNAGTVPLYQWKVNGTNVGTGSTYNNPLLTNNDIVSCVLTPDLPGCSAVSYVSNTATYRTTTITTQPLSQSICTGGSATLTVAASGSSLNYQWRKNGVNISGATTSSYTISGATAASAGSYDVMVNTGGCTSNAAVISVSTVNQWSGVTSSAWANTGNWTCGIIPNAATDVIIPSAALNMPLISTAVSINNLTINTSGTLTNNAAGTLTLNADLVNNGTYTDNGTTVFSGTVAQNITGATNFYNVRLNNAAGLNLNSTSTIRGVLTLATGTFNTNNNLNIDLYNGSIAGTGTGATTGNIRFFKIIWSNRYHYISSPIPGRTAADWNDNVTINFGANTNMYYYNEALPDTSVKVGWTAVTALSQPLQTMTGYALFFRAFPTTVIDVAGPYTHNMGTISSGTLTNTKSTVPTFKPSSDGWNHLGNPYPSTIDWAAASGWTKTGVDNAIYYWDPRNDRFSAYVAGIGTNGGTRYIGSMQGFFVKVSTSGGTGSVSMTNAVRTSAINVDVWRTSNDASILRLTATSGASSDETVIRLLDSTTTTFDGQYDAYKMMNEGQTPSLYTNYNADNYAINSIPYSSFNETIPVTIDAKFAGNYAFTADITGFEDADSVIFVDKHTHARQDLRINPSYTVDLAKANYTDRFYIQYNKKESVVTDTKSGVLSEITVYSFEQKVTVNFNNTKVATADLTIYDMKGNAVYKAKNQNVANGKLEVNLPFVSSGVYIVKVESGQASKTQEVYLSK